MVCPALSLCRFSTLRAILVLAAAGAVAGCSSTQPPTLKVVSAHVKDRTEAGAVIEFVVEAENPNGDALPLKDVNYTVTLDGREVFTGMRSAEATIRRYGRQQIGFPAAVKLEPGLVVPPVSKYTISGDVVYLVPGAIAETMFDQEVIEPKASFSGEGTVEIPPPPTGK